MSLYQTDAWNKFSGFAKHYTRCVRLAASHSRSAAVRCTAKRDIRMHLDSSVIFQLGHMGELLGFMPDSLSVCQESLEALTHLRPLILFWLTCLWCFEDCFWMDSHGDLQPCKAAGLLRFRAGLPSWKAPIWIFIRGLGYDLTNLRSLRGKKSQLVSSGELSSLIWTTLTH